MITLDQYILECIDKYKEKVKALKLISPEIEATTNRRCTENSLLQLIQRLFYAELVKSTEMTFEQEENSKAISCEVVTLCILFIRRYKMAQEIDSYMQLDDYHYDNLKNSFICELQKLENIGENDVQKIEKRGK